MRGYSLPESSGEGEGAVSMLDTRVCRWSQNLIGIPKKVAPAVVNSDSEDRFSFNSKTATREPIFFPAINCTCRRWRHLHRNYFPGLAMHISSIAVRLKLR